MDVVASDVSAKVNLSTLRLFLVRPKEGGPTTNLRLSSDAAFFEYRDGRYVLTALLVLKPRHNEEQVRILTDGMLTLYHDGGMSLTNYKHRGSMKVAGTRDARNGGYGRHTVGGKLRRSAEAVGCLMASLAGLVLIAPYLGGALCKHIAGALSAGGNLWASMWPFSLLALTVDYENYPHVDRGDEGKCFICWVQKGRVFGGEFVLDEYGAEFTPRHGTLLWLDASTVSHYTKPILHKDEGSTRVGIGLAVSSLL